MSSSIDAYLGEEAAAAAAESARRIRGGFAAPSLALSGQKSEEGGEKRKAAAVEARPNFPCPLLVISFILLNDVYQKYGCSLRRPACGVMR